MSLRVPWGRGNLVHEALAAGAKIDKVILLATPHMYDPDFNWRGKFIKNDYLHKPNLKNVGQVWNVYSEQDTVQVGWAEFVTAWQASRTPGYSATDTTYTNIEITSELRKQFPDKWKWLPGDNLSGPWDGYKTHGKLHSPEMAVFYRDILLGKQGSKNACKNSN